MAFARHRTHPLKMTFARASRTFSDCKLKNGECKLGNNLWLHRSNYDASYVIRYHNTSVIKIFPGDRYALSYGNWKTPSTMSVFADYLPFQIHKVEGSWVVPFVETVAVKGDPLRELVDEMQSPGIVPERWVKWTGPIAPMWNASKDIVALTAIGGAFGKNAKRKAAELLNDFVMRDKRVTPDYVRSQLEMPQMKDVRWDVFILAPSELIRYAEVESYYFTASGEPLEDL